MSAACWHSILVSVTDILGAGDDYDTLTWAKTAVRAIQQPLTTSKMVLATWYWSYFKAMDVSCMLVSHLGG
jgi:hypothetical protein